MWSANWSIWKYFHIPGREMITHKFLKGLLIWKVMDSSFKRAFFSPLWTFMWSVNRSIWKSFHIPGREMLSHKVLKGHYFSPLWTFMWSVNLSTACKQSLLNITYLGSLMYASECCIKNSLDNQMAYGRHRCKICSLDHKTSTTHYDPNYRGRTNLKQNPKQTNLTF